MNTDTSQLVQGSDEWKQARCGKLTASRLHEAIAKTRTGWGASRANLMASLIAERLTGVPADTYQSPAMIWGADTEPQARAAYAFYRNVEVEEVGFIQHPSIEASGASPDGCIGKDGLVELKCPGTAQHIETLLGQKIADKYIVQMQWQMSSGQRAWCDFCSYDPRLRASMQLFVQRIQRDEARIAELEKEVRAFLSELDEKVAKLIHLYEIEEAA